MGSGEINKATAAQFKRFDIVSDPSDHYYSKQSKIFNFFNSQNNDCFTNENSVVHRKIMKEWKILRKNLPESIYVRVYEDRIDLLRAVIVGAPGTPYHNGLFFFDVAFPSNYPEKPPKVCYHSHGLRLNPNLYASGYVCLSLINTWNGDRNEKWDSSLSTILQLLVSIQGLVLNEKPYFNEPGYGKWGDKQTWDRKSMDYNEDVFAFSCKTMLYVLRKPPKNFEAFVSQHFRERANDILAAVCAYVDGHVIVGCYQHDDDDDDGSSSSSEVSMSTRFQDDMSALYWDLREAFGTLVLEFAQGEKPKGKGAKKKKMSTDLKPQSIVKKQPKQQGILKRFIGVLKWLFWE